jgi:hypothetical protein
MKNIKLNHNYQNLKTRELVLYNSNKHSFSETADAIWVAVGYDLLQCEQLALFIKLKGQATIKTGNLQELSSIMESLDWVGQFNTVIH